MIFQAVEYDSPDVNIKYVLCKMIGDTCGSELGRKIVASRDTQDIWYILLFCCFCASL